MNNTNLKKDIPINYVGMSFLHLSADLLKKIKNILSGVRNFT